LFDNATLGAISRSLNIPGDFSQESLISISSTVSIRLTIKQRDFFLQLPANDAVVAASAIQLLHCWRRERANKSETRERERERERERKREKEREWPMGIGRALWLPVLILKPLSF